MNPWAALGAGGLRSRCLSGCESVGRDFGGLAGLLGGD